MWGVNNVQIKEYLLIMIQIAQFYIILINMANNFTITMSVKNVKICIKLWYSVISNLWIEIHIQGRLLYLLLFPCTAVPVCRELTCISLKGNCTIYLKKHPTSCLSTSYQHVWPAEALSAGCLSLNNGASLVAYRKSIMVAYLPFQTKVYLQNDLW